MNANAVPCNDIDLVNGTTELSEIALTSVSQISYVCAAFFYFPIDTQFKFNIRKMFMKGSVLHISLRPTFYSYF